MFDPCITHHRFPRKAGFAGFFHGLAQVSKAHRLRHNRSMNLLVRFVPGTTPLVLDSPHSGIDYPADYGHACDPVALRQAEDTHVEKLYDFAPTLGVAWIEAL